MSITYTNIAVAIADHYDEEFRRGRISRQTHYTAINRLAHLTPDNLEDQLENLTSRKQEGVYE